MSRPSNKAVLLFSGGEVTPKLGARSDIEKLPNACRTLQNMIVRRTGPVTRRVGLEWIGSVKGTNPGAGVNLPGSGEWHGAAEWDDPLSTNFVAGTWSLLVEHVAGNDYDYTFDGTMTANHSINPWQMRFTQSGNPAAAPIHVSLDYLGNVITGAKTGTIEIPDPSTFEFFVHMGDVTVGFGVTGDSIMADALFLLSP